MRIAITFAFLIAGCLAFDLPTFPDSRDSNGVVNADNGTLTVTEDQNQDRFTPETGVRFELFTLNNPVVPQTITPLNPETIVASNFNASNPTRFYIHGWRANRAKINRFPEAYLVFGRHNVNYIFVNWLDSSTPNNYRTARQRVNLIGPYVARLLNLLVQRFNVRLSDIHIVGHSLGAHIGGIAGKRVSGGKIAKITGLDPASPLFDYNAHESRLHHADAEYVESVHSNGGRLSFFLPIGQASFYPNRGRSQPGCGFDPTGRCSHGRAIEYFLESLHTTVHFFGLFCETLDAMAAGRCNIVNNGTHMGGEPGNLGNVRGIYYFVTNKQAPFAIGRPPTSQ